MIPPWVRPESPETIRMIDDATVAFQPAFGRGQTQRGIFADPRWGLRRRYRGLRSDEKAAILNVLNESRGQLNQIRVTPHTPIRGSLATSELLSNNTFASGTTGWSSGSGYTIAVSDRIVRATRIAMTGADYALASSVVSCVQYAPYVARFFVAPGRGSYFATGATIDDTQNSVTGSLSTNLGLRSQVFVPSATTISIGLADREASGLAAGDFLSITYASLARCMLVDAGPNYLLQSRSIDNAAWVKQACSIGANVIAGVENSNTADGVIESAANTLHYVQQTNTVSSAAADICFAAYVRGAARGWIALLMTETTGSTQTVAYLNLTTGALGTQSASGNWSNQRAFARNMGNSWWYIALIARKTNAATSVESSIFGATADNTPTYAGNGVTTGFHIDGTAFSPSSVPIRITNTTSSATTAGTSPTGSGVYVKGLPISTAGLLLSGDWVEINGELKRITAPLNSDAAGLGYLQLRPGLAGGPADNDPVIVYEPFGRFIYPGMREFENLFGIYGDCEMNLEEVYS